MSAVARLVSAFALVVFAGGLPASAGDQPGRFDYYSLVLSWSPTYCATQGRSRPNEPQCAGDRPYAFVLHGFWPQYNRGYPKDCQTGERPWVPDDIIKGMIDIMPSKRLVIHEYRAHGVCSGLDPQSYFRVSRQAYDAIKIPARFQNVQDYLTVTPDEIESEFLKANPGLTPEMINIDCKDRQLRELRICFTRDVKLKACGTNEEQATLCSSSKIVMPPVRIGTYRENDEGNYDQDRGGREDGTYEEDDDPNN